MTEDVLARAVQHLATATDPAAALDDLSALLIPTLSDWCLADVLRPPDLVTRVAARGVDGPLGLPPHLGDVHARRSSAQAGGLLARLVQTPGGRLLVSAEQVRELQQSEDARLRAQAELALSLGTVEVLVLGLSNRDELHGVLSLGRTGSRFLDHEIEQLGRVAELAGLALAGLRLRELQRGVSAALQRSLLPALPLVPGLTLAARFTPAVDGLAVGGDWYDAFALPTGGLALVIGDATGHDVQAAARMAELRNLLRAVAVDAADPPASTLARLDRVVDAVAPELSGTCLYAQVATGAGGAQLRWSSAGHLPPVLLRRGAAELLETPPDLMLGVRIDTARADHQRELQAGDCLVLYTDGLVEDRRSVLDERLEALRRLVETAGGDGPERLADVLVERLASREDDVAVLVVRVDEPQPVGAG